MIRDKKTLLDRPSQMLGPSNCDLALRILGTERDGQIVRLSSPKCTIGSSPDCTLRLVCPGVRPLHCLILRGKQGMAIRRWSPDTLLNGQTFSDAPLLPGDRLSIGPVQFEVLPEAERLKSQSQRPMRSFREMQEGRDVEKRRIRRLLRNVRRASAKIQHLETEITQRHQEGAGLLRRVRELEEQLQQSRNQWASLDETHRTAQLHDEQTRSTIENLERRLSEQRQAYDKDRDAWLVQCKQVADVLQTVGRAHQDTRQEHSALAHRAEELDGRFQQILASEQALSDQQADLERARREFDHQVHTWGEKQQHLSNELNRHRQAFDDQRKQWRQEQDQRQHELDERSRCVEEQFARLAADREEFESKINQQDAERHQQLNALAAKCEALQQQLDEAHTHRERIEREWQERHTESEQRRTQLEELRQQGEEQKQQLESELASCQQQLAELRQQWEHHEHAGGQLDERERALEVEWQRLGEERDELQRSKTEAEQQGHEHGESEYAQRRQEIDNERQKLNAEREELRLQRAEWEEGRHEQIANMNARCEDLTREIHTSQERVGQLEAELDQLRQQDSADEHRAAEFDRERQQWDEERHRLEAELEAKQQELHELQDRWQEDSERARNELEQRTQELEQKFDQLTAEQQSFEQERASWEERCSQQAEWESEREQQEETISQRQAELDREFHRLAEEREALERERIEHQAGAEQQRELELRISSWEEQRQREQEELDQARQQLESDREKWGSQQTQADSDNAVSDGIEDDNQDICSTIPVGMLDQIRTELETNTAGAESDSDSAEEDASYTEYKGVTEEDELSFSSPPEEAPVDTASILAKYGQSLDFDDEGQQQPVELVEPSVPANGLADTEESAEGEDGSIQDYMALLLQRVGSGPMQQPSPNLPAPVEEPRQAENETVVETQPAERKEKTTPMEPGEFIPRAVAPEAQSNLKALRDVANTSARNAIDKHQRHRFEHTGMIYAFVGIVSLMVSGTMAVWAKGFFTVPAFAAFVAFLVSAFSLTRGMSLTAKAKVKGAEEASETDEASVTTEDQPVNEAN